MLRVRLAKEVRADDEQRFHFVGEGIAGGVEHAQVRAQRDGLAREIAAAMNLRLQIDIGEQRIDVLRRTQNCKRLVDVAGRQVSDGPSPESSFPRLRG